MKFKTMLKKIVVVICIAALFVCSFDATFFQTWAAESEKETSYIPVTLADLSDNYQAGNVTDSYAKYTKSAGLNWDGMQFEGKFKFAYTGTEQANMLVLGHTSKGGLRIYINKNGQLQLRLHDYNTSNSKSRVTDVKITAAQLGVETIANTELRLKLYFDIDIENMNTEANTADVAVKVEINGNYITSITQKDYQLVYMSRVAWLIGTVDYPLYHDSKYERTTVKLSDLIDNYESGNSINQYTKYTKCESMDWNHTEFSGRFKFDFTGTNEANMLLLGSTAKARGIKIFINDNSQLQIRLIDNGNSGGKARYVDAFIVASDLGIDSLLKAEIELKVNVDFVNVDTTGNTADVTVTVQANNYTVSLSQTAFQLDFMKRVAWLIGTADYPLYHDSQYEQVNEYEVIRLSDMTDNYVEGNSTNSNTKYTKCESQTLDHTEFEGTFQFDFTGVNEANMLVLGSVATGGGLKIFINDAGQLQIRLLNGKPFESSVRFKDVKFDAADLGLSGSIVKTALKLNVKIDFANEDTNANLADVTVQVKINNQYEASLTLEKFQLTYMKRVAWLIGTADYPLYHNSQAQGGEVIPPEEEEPEEIGPVLNPNAYELVALSDLTDNYEEGYVTDNKTKYTKGETETWADTVFKGTFKFNYTGTEQANMLVLGHTSKGGLRIFINKYGELQLRLHDYNTSNSTSRVTDVKLTAAQIGVETIENTELKLRLYFDFENVDAEANTADVIVRVEINDKFITGITQKDYQLAYMNRVAWLIGTKDYPLYHNSVNDEAMDTEEVPTLNPNFKELTFASYEIKTGTYKYADKKLSAKGQAELNNLDGVIFSDTVNFSNEPGACICFGGVKTAWQGLNILSTAKGEIQLKAATGKPFEPIVFKSEYAGVDLTGQDIEFTMSFEYVDADGDGQKNDVKLGVWFNGKAYRNKWYYLPNFAEQLGSHLGIYIPNEATTLTVKTYTEPFVFEEFGFTKDWKKELRLNK